MTNHRLIFFKLKVILLGNPLLSYIKALWRSFNCSAKPGLKKSDFLLSLWLLFSFLVYNINNVFYNMLFLKKIDVVIFRLIFYDMHCDYMYFIFSFPYFSLIKNVVNLFNYSRLTMFSN